MELTSCGWRRCSQRQLPGEEKTQLCYKSQAMCFSQENIFDMKLENSESVLVSSKWMCWKGFGSIKAKCGALLWFQGLHVPCALKPDFILFWRFSLAEVITTFHPLFPLQKPLDAFRLDEKVSLEGRPLSVEPLQLTTWVALWTQGLVHCSNGPNPPGSFDNLISSWRSGEQVSGNASSWCCFYRLTRAQLSQNLSEGIRVWFPYKW